MLFDRNIPPACSYCFFGKAMSDSEVACKKRGIMSPEGFCRRFKYDPLKREPIRIRYINNSEYSKEDFEL